MKENSKVKINLTSDTEIFLESIHSQLETKFTQSHNDMTEEERVLMENTINSIREHFSKLYKKQTRQKKYAAMSDQEFLNHIKNCI